MTFQHALHYKILIDQLLSIREMVGCGHQGEEAVIDVAYFKVNYAMRVDRHDKGSALFHIIIFVGNFVYLLDDFCYWYD